MEKNSKKWEMNSLKASYFIESSYFLFRNQALQ